MIVVDASAVVEALVGQRPAPGLLELLAGELHAPHLLDVEVSAVLRGLSLGRRLTDGVLEEVRSDYAALTITRYEHQALADRCWDLQHQFTTYDASYLALAEALGAPLVTCDAKLAAPGHRAAVHVLPLMG